MAGLFALIIHKRRMIGMGDLRGPDAYREWFKTDGFFEDRGAPGHDVRFGLGVPLIKNILAWLKETTWV